MAKQVKIRRGTEAQCDAMTPALAEFIYDTTNKQVRIGDGSTLGGLPLAKISDLTSSVPPGAIFDWAGATAPSGYLLCYGQAISRATYADLWAEIGTTYGSGDGSSTFNLPDCRGRVSAGKDDMGGSSANRLTNQTGGLNGDVLGATGGTETHSLTSAQVPSNSVTINGGPAATGDPNVDQDYVMSAAHTGTGSAHNNVQPTIIFNKIIKY